MKKKRLNNHYLLITIIAIVVALIFLNPQTSISREAYFGNSGGIMQSSKIYDWNANDELCHGGYVSFMDSGNKNYAVLSLPITVPSGTVVSEAELKFYANQLMDDGSGDDGNLKITIVTPTNDVCGDCFSYNEAVNCGLLSGGQVISNQYYDEDEYVNQAITYNNGVIKNELQKAIDQNKNYVYVVFEAIADSDGEAKGKIYTNEEPFKAPTLIYSHGECDPSDPCCELVAGTTYGSFKNIHTTDTCPPCMECNGNDAQCVYQSAGSDYGNDCSSNPWTCTGFGNPGTCSRTKNSGDCDGSGSCETITEFAPSANVCIDGDFVIAAYLESGVNIGGTTYQNLYSAIDSSPSACSDYGNVNSGFGDALIKIYGCDGSGNPDGPAIPSYEYKPLDCGNGCCYQSGSTAQCVSSGNSGYDWAEFSTSDLSATDYCFNGEIKDCYDSNDCSGGSVCENNVCTAVDCFLDSDCPGTAVCETNTCVSVECLTNYDCSLGVCINNECGCTTNADCGLTAVCSSGVCNPVECTLDSQCSEGICLSNNECGCTINDDCGYQQICNSGSCLDVECMTTGQCAQGELCLSNICQPVSCTQDIDCTLGICLGSFTCGCNNDDDCGELAVCSNYACSPVECTFNSQCDSGVCEDNVCMSFPPQTVEEQTIIAPQQTPLAEEDGQKLLSWWNNISITVQLLIILLLLIIMYYVFEAGPNKGFIRKKTVVIKHQRGKRK